MTRQNLARLKLLGVCALFFGPLAAAFVLYYGMHDVVTGGVTNKGNLLSPAQPLPSVALTGPDGTTTSAEVLRQQWTFLQVAPDGCGPLCRENLAQTRQIWLLLHDERERVQRVLLVGAGQTSDLENRPGLEVYSGDLGPLRALLEKHSPGRAGTVYLIDPHGNWVLYYPPGQNGAGLFKDTKHLLELSHIG